MKQLKLKKNKVESESNLKLGFIKKFKFTPKEKRAWMILLAIFLTLSLIVGIYAIGYKIGYKQGKKDAVKTDGSRNAAASSNTNRTLLKTTNGKIESINEKEIVIKTLRNETKKIKIDDKTKITKRAKALKIADLKKGDAVVVFLNSKNEADQVATRIIVREQVKSQ